MDPVRAMTAGWAAVFGLVFGSFANVCITRLPRHESVVRPRSRCPRCGRPISAWENIPVWSWMALRGRCRGCRERISLRYPAVEIAVAGLWAAAAIRFGASAEGAGAAVLCWFLVTLFATDAETLLLPDALTVPLLALGLAVRVAEGAMRWGWSGGVRAGLHATGDAAGAALVLLVIRAGYWAARRRTGLGLGDVKLFAGMAGWLGAGQALLVFVLAVALGAVYGVGKLAILRRGDGAAMKVPLGSFLCLAGLYAIFYGEATVRWYLGFFPGN